jgi:parallel beta-helix repeat protein
MHVGAIMIAIGFAVFPASAGALVPLPIHPTRTDDPSSGGTSCNSIAALDTDCSLRNALIDATVNGESVSLGAPSPAGPYKVEQSTRLTISHNINLVGVGARSTTITRTTGLEGVFEIASGVTGATIRGVKITGGNTDTGGAIINSGVLTLRDSTLTGNQALGGGGGGVTDFGTGALTVIGSTISGNTGVAGGGAQIGGSAAFINSTISDNTAPGEGGGGIYVVGSSMVTLANVTLSSNHALAGKSGGNLFNFGSTVLAKNTIIASGTGASGSENCFGSITSQGYNLEDRNQCGLTGVGDQTGTDPLLGALQDNGGPTDTRAPSPDSPAVDHGNPGGCTDASSTVLTVDQRGMQRPQGLACDVGAYELQPIAPGVSAAPATGIRPRGATLNGTVDTHGFQTSGRFEYGPTTSYGSSTPTQTLASGTHAVSAMITGLLPDTPYHFKLVMSTSGGTAETADQTFTTAPDAPDVATGPATEITAAGSTLNGSVIPNGLPTTYQFWYGTTPAYGSATPAKAAGNGTSAVAASATITGLKPGTTYHYLLLATNALGLSMGADQTFTTAPSPGGAQPPALGSISILPSAFRAAASGASIAKARATGAAVTYTDTRPSTTAFTVLRARPGISLHGRCAPSRKHSLSRRARACTRYVTVGGFTHTDGSGRNRFRFTGRVGGRKLSPGTYRLDATPRSGGTAGNTASAGFRILK